MSEVIRNKKSQGLSLHRTHRCAMDLSCPYLDSEFLDCELLLLHANKFRVIGCHSHSKLICHHPAHYPPFMPFFQTQLLLYHQADKSTFVFIFFLETFLLTFVDQHQKEIKTENVLSTQKQVK